MDRLLTSLGLALRAGKLAVGESPVYEALDRGKARRLFLASDAAGNTAERLARRRGEVPLSRLAFTKEELGRALGRRVCALCAVTDPGFAASLARLTATDPTNPNDGGVTI